MGIVTDVTMPIDSIFGYLNTDLAYEQPILLPQLWHK